MVVRQPKNETVIPIQVQQKTLFPDYDPVFQDPDAPIMIVTQIKEQECGLNSNLIQTSSNLYEIWSRECRAAFITTLKLRISFLKKDPISNCFNFRIWVASFQIPFRLFSFYLLFLDLRLCYTLIRALLLCLSWCLNHFRPLIFTQSPVLIQSSVWSSDWMFVNYAYFLF